MGKLLYVLAVGSGFFLASSSFGFSVQAAELTKQKPISEMNAAEVRAEIKKIKTEYKSDKKSYVKDKRAGWHQFMDMAKGKGSTTSEKIKYARTKLETEQSLKDSEKKRSEAKERLKALEARLKVLEG